MLVALRCALLQAHAVRLSYRVIPLLATIAETGQLCFLNSILPAVEQERYENHDTVENVSRRPRQVCYR